MKKIIMLIVLSSPLINGCSDNETNQNLQIAELSQIEIDDLMFSREEEKLARDVYIYNYKKYGNNVFNNISKSEQNHMDQILDLLNYYSLPDPIVSDEIGVFKNEELQNLYNELINKSNISNSDALEVGAIIEDLDINDLNNLISHTNTNNIIAVYERLKCGSQNHMRSFTNQLQSVNINYEPQYISLEDYSTIINSSSESCNNF
jgi:hypothetical protein